MYNSSICRYTADHLGRHHHDRCRVATAAAAVDVAVATAGLDDAAAVATPRGVAAGPSCAVAVAAGDANTDYDDAEDAADDEDALLAVAKLVHGLE
jgi:hypothetical protein